MKTIACLLVLSLCSCGTGTTLYFGPKGVVVTPPAGPIVIPDTGK